MKILALDMSSTNVGLCYDGKEFETISLRGDIAKRCELAARLIIGWIIIWEDIDLIVIESPVGRFTKAVIPQARVSGAVLSEFSRRNLAWVELAPQLGKKALTGKGNADKQAMILAAGQKTGQLLNEHQADAFGLYLAAKAIKVESRAA